MQLFRKLSLAWLLCLAAPTAHAQPLEQVATFHGAMPTGVTVSHAGRIFVCYPHWGDPVQFTVGEIKNGQTMAYPNAQVNKLDPRHPEACLYSVQSVVVDPKDRLWALDTGSVKLGATVPNGPKLVCMDLKTNTITRKFFFPRDVALPTTYLNDIRFDLRRGKGGYAFITNSADKGPNGIIVVDLASGKSWRRLNDHLSTKAEKHFLPIVESQPLKQRKPGETPQNITMGSDGIAISADGKQLFYCPLASRRLYSVSVDALVDQTKSDSEVGQTVKDLGLKGASDGLETDAQGRLYATDYEHALVKRGQPGGPYTTIVKVASLYWPDTLSVATNGYLYFTANELQRQPSYHYGKDLRVKPYRLYRVKIKASPVLLK